MDQAEPHVGTIFHCRRRPEHLRRLLIQRVRVGEIQVFGLLALTLVFVIIQAFWMASVSSKNDTAAEEPEA